MGKAKEKKPDKSADAKDIVQLLSESSDDFERMAKIGLEKRYYPGGRPDYQFKYLYEDSNIYGAVLAAKASDEFKSSSLSQEKKDAIKAAYDALSKDMKDQYAKLFTKKEWDQKAWDDMLAQHKKDIKQNIEKIVDFKPLADEKQATEDEKKAHAEKTKLVEKLVAPVDSIKEELKKDWESLSKSLNEQKLTVGSEKLKAAIEFDQGVGALNLESTTTYNEFKKKAAELGTFTPVGQHRFEPSKEDPAAGGLASDPVRLARAQRIRNESIAHLVETPAHEGMRYENDRFPGLAFEKTKNGVILCVDSSLVASEYEKPRILQWWDEWKKKKDEAYHNSGYYNFQDAIYGMARLCIAQGGWERGTQVVIDFPKLRDSHDANKTKKNIEKSFSTMKDLQKLYDALDGVARTNHLIGELHPDITNWLSELKTRLIAREGKEFGLAEVDRKARIKKIDQIFDFQKRNLDESVKVREQAAKKDRMVENANRVLSEVDANKPARVAGGALIGDAPRSGRQVAPLELKDVLSDADKRKYETATDSKDKLNIIEAECKKLEERLTKAEAAKSLVAVQLSDMKEMDLDKGFEKKHKEKLEKILDHHVNDESGELGDIQQRIDFWRAQLSSSSDSFNTSDRSAHRDTMEQLTTRLEEMAGKRGKVEDEMVTLAANFKAPAAKTGQANAPVLDEPVLDDEQPQAGHHRGPGAQAAG